MREKISQNANGDSFDVCNVYDGRILKASTIYFVERSL